MNKSAWTTVAVGIVWAAVILAAAAVPKDTPYWRAMLPILGGGASATIVILGGSRSNGGQNAHYRG